VGSDTSLDDKWAYLIEAIRALGSGFHSRADIASHLEKAKLNPAEILALDFLAERGVLEKLLQQSETAAQISRYVYRLAKGE
jgi:hypothetical protein